MNDVVIVDHSGNTLVFLQDDIVAPKFDCDGCYTAEEYIHRIGEYGMTTVVNNGDGTFTYNFLSPACICTVSFTNQCSATT